MTYAGLDFTTADEDLERIETGFGAAMSAHPVNHITAGDIDSGKMIEGLDPRKATLTECKRAFKILYDNFILYKDDYDSPLMEMRTHLGDSGVSLYYSDKEVDQQEAAYNFGLLAAHAPKGKYLYQTKQDIMGHVVREQIFEIDNLSILATMINGLAKAKGGQKVLNEITMIQDYEHNNFKGC